MGAVTESAVRTVVLEVDGVQWATQGNVVEAVVGRQPGVMGVEANPVAQTATVTYDPARTSVRAAGSEPAGRLLLGLGVLRRRRPGAAGQDAGHDGTGCGSRRRRMGVLGRRHVDRR